MSDQVKFEKWIEFRPAFDKRSDDPSKNFGIHGAEMKWFLRGPKGVVQFVVYTNWHLPHVEEELDAKSDKYFPHLCCHPQPADIGYHAFTPQYEGQKPIQDDCPVMGGKPCYYDGSGLQSEEVFRLLISDGHEAVWKEMESRYQSIK